MFITKKNIKNLVFCKLSETKFPLNSSRVNVSQNKTTSFALGEVNYRGQKKMDGKTRGPSRFNRKFPELFTLLKDLIKLWKPDFPYTTIQVNKNVVSMPHIDKNNIGPSYGIALGDFYGGELVIEGSNFCIKNKFKKFNGTLGHWITPFSGTRYSLIYFTHTFKPPCPSLRNIKISKEGMYKKNILIKSYKETVK